MCEFGASRGVSAPVCGGGQHDFDASHSSSSHLRILDSLPRGVSLRCGPAGRRLRHRRCGLCSPPARRCVARNAGGVHPRAGRGQYRPLAWLAHRGSARRSVRAQAGDDRVRVGVRNSFPRLGVRRLANPTGDGQSPDRPGPRRRHSAGDRAGCRFCAHDRQGPVRASRVAWNSDRLRARGICVGPADRRFRLAGGFHRRRRGAAFPGAGADAPVAGINRSPRRASDATGQSCRALPRRARAKHGAAVVHQSAQSSDDLLPSVVDPRDPA